MAKNLSGSKGSVSLFLGISLLVTVFGGVYFFRSNRKEEINNKSLLSRVTNISPTTTPFSFQELTIPYLRERKYKSGLGELKKTSENLSYTSYVASYDSDGFKIYGLLTVPKEGASTNAQHDSRKYPAIIFVHGYIPPQEYETTENYVSYVDYLARNGFVVFKIDLRGHGNSEGEPSGGYYSGDYVIDTLNAYAALQSTDFVDSDRIGLWGHSMAGNVVFRSFVAKGDIGAIVIWSGAGYTYTDLDEYSIDDASYRPTTPDSEQARKRRELSNLYGPFDPNSDFWKQVVPTNYLSDLSGAVSLNHAVGDNVVSIDYSKNLDSLLNQTNIIHELNVYPSGGHNLTGENFAAAMQNTVEFFKENL